ncbi:MAG: hypothetical protein A2Y02_00350 [Omnitrophica bacterium GWA2_52_12]|nr:MAG: hypothetical protein A2Y02_00350 [Omnitrophica bacterium GWA2_52_12]
MSNDKAIFENLLKMFTTAPANYTESHVLSALGAENDTAWNELFTWASALGQSQGETFVRLATALREEAAEHAAATAKPAVVVSVPETVPPAAPTVPAADELAPQLALVETGTFKVLDPAPKDNGFGRLSIHIQITQRQNVGSFLAGFEPVRNRIGVGSGRVLSLDGERNTKTFSVTRDRGGRGTFDRGRSLEVGTILTVNVETTLRSEMRRDDERSSRHFVLSRQAKSEMRVSIPEIQGALKAVDTLLTGAGKLEIKLGKTAAEAELSWTPRGGLVKETHLVSSPQVAAFLQALHSLGANIEINTTMAGTDLRTRALQVFKIFSAGAELPKVQEKFKGELTVEIKPATKGGHRTLVLNDIKKPEVAPATVADSGGTKSLVPPAAPVTAPSHAAPVATPKSTPPAAKSAVPFVPASSVATAAEIEAANESVLLMAAYLSAPQNQQSVSAIISGLLKSPEHQYALDALVYGLEEQDSQVRSLFKVPAGFWENKPWQSALNALKPFFAEVLLKDFFYKDNAAAASMLPGFAAHFKQATWKAAALALIQGIEQGDAKIIGKFTDATHPTGNFTAGPGRTRIRLLQQTLDRLSRAAEAKSEMRQVLYPETMSATTDMIETLRLQAAGEGARHPHRDRSVRVPGTFSLFAREVTQATGGLYEAPETAAVREGLSLETALLRAFRAIAQEEGLALSAEDTLPVLKAAREALGEFSSLLDSKGENFKLVDLVPSNEFLNNETLYALAIYLLVRPGDDLRLYVTEGNKGADAPDANVAGIQQRLETILKKMGARTVNLQNRLKLVDAINWTEEELLRDVRRESSNRNQRLRTAVLSGRLQWLEALLIVPGQARVQRSITLQKAARILAPAVLSGSEIDERTVQQLTQLLAQKGYSDRLSARFAAMISAVRALVEAA